MRVRTSFNSGHENNQPCAMPHRATKRVRRETGKMRVHYDQGVANHIGPESCAVTREGIGEAIMGRPPPIVCSWLKTNRETRLDGASFRPQPTSVAVASWEFGMAFVRMVAGFVIIAMLASVAFITPVAVAQNVEDAATLTE